MYYDHFINDFRCAPDVLKNVRPLQRETKEISEAIAVTNRLRWVTQYPYKFNLLDLCAGNAVGSILASYRFRFSSVTAIDKATRKREKPYDVERFQYVNLDIMTDKVKDYIDNKTILMAIHPCTNKAERIINLYNNTEATFLVVMPCCVGSYQMKMKSFLKDQLGSYLTWCFYLASGANGSLVADKRAITPCNGVIVASKGREKE